MRKNIWLLVFTFALLADLSAILANFIELRYFCKPLIIFSVLVYFIFQTENIKSPLKKWIMLALFLSWVGDILLLMEENDELYFLLGLSAFLLAHLSYIIFFHNVRLKEAVRPKFPLLVLIVIYYAGLIFLLSPQLGDMKLPVRMYGLVISFMLMLALHMLYIRNKKAGQMMATGALFFIVSDSLLAINKFYNPFEPAGILIMLTYGLAQLFITEGSINYIRRQ